MRISIDMRRLNPKTGEVFRQGDVHGDGRVFWSYTKFVRKDGFFAEDWRSLEKFDKATQAKNKAIKNWKAANKHKSNSYWAKRNAQKLCATPKWLSIDHIKMIEDFYAKAVSLTSSTGIAYQVDHIVPLQGVNVCGLHVPWNLQVLTASENAAKRNRHE